MARRLTYDTAHDNVKLLRGSASLYECVCGEQALDWAYQHTAESPFFREDGRPFSSNPCDYAPMCRSCHTRLDRKKSPWGPPTGEKNSLVQWWAEDSDRAFAQRSEAGKKGSAVMLARPGQIEILRARRALNNTRKRRCSCGKESTVAGIGRHQQVSGHEGWVAL